jgi:TonB family protein
MPIRLACRFVAALVTASALSVPALAQTPASAPARPRPAGLVASVPAVPSLQSGNTFAQATPQEEIANNLDLARQYLSQRQYEEAERALTRALALIELQRRASLTLSPGAGGPVRVGGTVREPLKIHHVDPVYPEVALRARVQGVVILEIVVDPQGNVVDARVVRSVALLDQAALDAVHQWKFRPTLLDGSPVSVKMTVTVNFKLPGRSR